MWAEWDVRKVWILTVESFPRNFSNYVANAACICGCICDSGSSIRSNGMHAAPHFSMFLANSASRNSILIKFLYPRPLCELGKLSFAIPETYEVIQSFQKSKLVQSAMIGYFSSVTDNMVTTYTIILGSSKDTTNPLRITSMMSCRVTSEILSIIIRSFISR